MCGIAGYFGKDFKNKNIINSTLKLLHHRGPDSKGFFYTKIIFPIIYILCTLD